MLKQPLHALLAELVDYAGLFPPAALEMAQVVANYALYRADPHAWVLARLIVPVGRLAEFEAASQLVHPGNDAVPWRISALAGANLAADLASIAAFNARQAGRTAYVDTIELKASTVQDIRALKRALPDGLTAYVELPVGDDPRPLIDELAAHGLRGKVRAGGVLPELFPPPADLIRFLAACVAAKLPFKATAGLHHPIRAPYRLTYAPDSPRAVMYGYLNVFLAAAFLHAGMAEGEAQKVLEETSPAAFQFGDAEVAWRGSTLTTAQLAEARQIANAFGSCSFREPVDDLKALGLI